ncbi:hypothetical protein CH063_06133 [Colletotrichum higginsianum]|uniref:Uncharacterized protein n=2 Tax=Colletotrichum higginsianum TaxID=80884 RepID=H1V1F9_COLHI|nr:hypothetical protein CH63R_03038 [Colletotrichum higginsianum IMI 349063]OBR14312.1 hypothetical protein CH63R_03038 [Colletotrichum higginsianum IMI 349063]TID02284.1 hypothetical protein CH35J_004433 [Colletotrichum higginsianum]GJC95033.1 hypothetical protein ColKHC_03859 [Colletotrichum higginsianum]CCF34061.1 hypothetical protein CH063_06133 [Colletotrichum higginsianum]
MFRLTTASARHGRALLTGFPPPAVQAAAPAMATRRTLKGKAPRPSPGSNKKSGPSMLMKDRPELGTPRPLFHFQNAVKSLRSQHVTGQEAHDIYMKYFAAAAVKEKPVDWRQTFVKDNNISAAKLYETAMALMSSPNSSDADFDGFCNMLDTAAGQGDDAAALTLGRMLHNRSEKSYLHWDQMAWRNTRERCRALIEAGRDPNALVLKGLVYLSRRTSEDNRIALEAFIRAEEIGKGADSFEWYSSCLRGQSEVYIRKGNKTKAAEVLTRLGEMGYAEGFWGLAKLFPKDESTMYRLQKAASSGLMPAHQALVNEHERLRKLCRAQGREEEARRHERDAAEWTLIMRAETTRDRESKLAAKSDS